MASSQQEELSRALHVPSCVKEECRDHMDRLVDRLTERGVRSVYEARVDYKPGGKYANRFTQHFTECRMTIIHICPQLLRKISQVKNVIQTDPEKTCFVHIPCSPEEYPDFVDEFNVCSLCNDAAVNKFIDAMVGADIRHPAAPDLPSRRPVQQTSQSQTGGHLNEMFDVYESSPTNFKQVRMIHRGTECPVMHLRDSEFSAINNQNISCTMPKFKNGGGYSVIRKRPKEKKMKIKTINPLTGRMVTIKEVQGSFLFPASSQQPIPATSCMDALDSIAVESGKEQRQEQDTVVAVSSQQPVPATSCMDAFDSIAMDPENGVSSYWKKKANRSDKWEQIRQELLVVHTELCAFPDQSQCICCGFNLPTIRCLDCGSHALFCEDDFLERHKNAVFHSPEIWNGCCFVPYAANLPVLVHSNHKVPTCAKRTREITVIGMRGGPQLFTFEFCSCESDTITLLRHRLWGSSPEIPSVAFKLDVMEWLRALVLECQVSVKGFVNALATRLSKIENVSSKKVNGVYQALVTDAFTMYMRHEYQLQQVQHIDPDLDDGTSCPACHVVNEDIAFNSKDHATDGSQLVLSENSQIFSFDANFGLSRKKSSGKSPGEPFHKGRYFIDQTDVDEFVKNYSCHTKKGAGDCSDFQAGSHRSKSRTDKLDETAVFGCACSRHEFPHRFFSLKHGERLGYAVCLMEKLMEQHPQKIYIMYDIACVLSAHLKKSNSGELPSNIQFLLPIFHSFGHKMACQLEYGPRTAAGIGLTDGETVERLWSYLRKFSSITKMMTPQRRVDLLTDALLHYASKLRKRLGKHLEQKFTKAETTRQDSEGRFQDLTRSFQEPVDAAKILQWRHEEKAACRKNDVSSNKKDNYMITLFQLYQKQSASGPSEESAESSTELSVLAAKVTRLENQHGFVRPSKDSSQYKEMLTSAVVCKRKLVLEQMRAVSSERSYSLMQLAEARGQEMAKRMSGVVTRHNKRLKSLLTTYNNFAPVEGLETLPATLQFADVADRGSWVYGVVPETSAVKRKVIQLSDLMIRCAEEKGLLKRDAAAAHSWYKLKQRQCQEHLDRLPNLSQYDRGCRALIFQHMFHFENMLGELELLTFAEFTALPKPALQFLSAPHEVPSVDTDVQELSELELEEVMFLLQQGEENLEEESDDEENVDE